MSRQSGQVWATLVQAGLVQGPAPATENLESPWYVKALLAFSGWLAAVFMLGFISMGLGFVLDSSLASFITGGLMIGGAFGILRLPGNEFVEHLALATSLAGQVLVLFALYNTTAPDGQIFWLLATLLETALVIVMPNFVHRAFSSFFAAVFLFKALQSTGAPAAISAIVMFPAAWLWLNEFRYPRQMRKIRATGYGLVLALISLKTTLLFGLGTSGWGLSRAQPGIWLQPWMGEALAGLVTLYVVWQLLQRQGKAVSSRLAITALAGTLLLCAVSMEARGITIGMTIMLLGFAGSNRVLLGLGIVSLLFYISSYYYLLDTTLLVKSWTLLIVGVALFALRWSMLRIMPGEREATDVR